MSGGVLFALGFGVACEEEPELRDEDPAFLIAMADHLERTYRGLDVVMGYAVGLQLIAAGLEQEVAHAR